MSDQEHSASLMVLQALVLLMIEKGLLEREEILAALEDASTALAEEPDPIDVAAVRRITTSVRTA
jgi:hypothetical protein